MESSLINLTPHHVVLLAPRSPADRGMLSGTIERLLRRPAYRVIRRIPPTGASARLTEQAGTLYVTSPLFAEALRRDDIVFPFREVRDRRGRVIGCQALARITTRDGVES